MRQLFAVSSHPEVQHELMVTMFTWEPSDVALHEMIRYYPGIIYFYADVETERIGMEGME